MIAQLKEKFNKAEKKWKVYIFMILKTAGQLGMSHVCLSIDWVWIGEWIYWPLIHTTRNDKQL
jgi:microsomal dipeptidase-like Zn-dependent dipeptidase